MSHFGYIRFLFAIFNVFAKLFFHSNGYFCHILFAGLMFFHIFAVKM